MRASNHIEWQEILEDNMSKGFIKFHSTIGLLLNIVIPIVLLLFFKVDIITYLLCFVVFDALQVVLEYLILFIHKNILSLSWFIQKGGYKTKLENMSPSEIEYLKNQLNTTNSFYNEKLKMINDKIEELKDLESVSTPASRKNEIIYVEEMIMKFKEYDNIPWIKDYMEQIVTISERLLAKVKEDEESVIVIINTYNIYSEELLKIVAKYEDMDEEEQDKCQPKVLTLMETFCGLLKDLEIKIQNSKKRSIDFDIDFLMKKLEEEKNKDV